MSSYKSTVPFYNRGWERCVFRCVLFLVWCFVWLESGVRYVNLDYVYYDMTDTRLIVVPMMISLLGIWIFKPYKLWTERTYFGKIERIDKQNAIVIKKDEKGMKVIVKKLRSAVYAGTNVLTIRRSDGKLVQRSVPNLLHFDSIYDLDTSVSVVCGVKFPVPMNKEVFPKGNCFCTKCGSFEQPEYKRCSMCHSLLWYK